MTYKPTTGDLAFDAAVRENPDLSIFDEAMLLRRVSDAYLTVMAHDHSGDRSAAFREMINAEFARRSAVLAKRANWIALAAVVISVAAFFA